MKQKKEKPVIEIEYSEIEQESVALIKKVKYVLRRSIFGFARLKKIKR